MPTVSLNAFLKIMSKGSLQKATEYGRYLNPGGYDFYWMLKEAIRARTIGGVSIEEARKPIEAINRPVEKKHNLAGLMAFDGWLVKQGIKEFFECSNASCNSPAGHLKIRLEPGFGYVWQGRRRIVHAWASQTASLSRNVAGCGLHLLKTHNCVGDYVDCTPVILDLKKRELFVADALPPIISPTVASELAWADGFFAASAKAA